MLVPQQATVNVDDVVPTDDTADVVADDVDDVVAHVDAEPTPPSPTPTATPPPPQQEVTSTPPLSPRQSPQQQPSSPPQQPQPLQTTTISMELLNSLLETYTALTRRVENLEQDKVAQALKITKLKQKVKRLEKKNKLKVSGGCIQIGGIIELIDADEDVILEEVDAEKDAKVAKENADVQGRQEESQAHAYHIDLEHVDKVLSMHDDEPEPAELKEVIEVVTTAKLMTEIVIRDPEETATPSTIIHSKPKSKDKGKGIMVEEPKPIKKQAQIEQDEAYARELEAALNRNINWDDVIKQ
nr:hypothetical protein [Tanacetum cinerariifolium]